MKKRNMRSVGASGAVLGLRLFFFLSVCLIALNTTTHVRAAALLPTTADLEIKEETTISESDDPYILPGCEEIEGFAQEIAVSAFGGVTGSCEHFAPPIPIYNFNTTTSGSYNGFFDSNSGVVQLIYKTTQVKVYNPTGKTWERKLSLFGTTDLDRSGTYGGRGTADFSMSVTCASLHPLHPCTPDETRTYSGTVEFTFFLLNTDTKVEHIELVQVVQSVKNETPLVAKKPTIARVFVQSPERRENILVTLKGWRDAQPLQAPIFVSGPSSTIATIDRDETQHSINFRLPESWTEPGAIVVEAEVTFFGGPIDPIPANNKLIHVATFETRSPLTVEYVPICVAGDVACPYPGVSTKPSLVEAVFPLPADGLVYRRAPGAALEIEALPTSLDEAEKIVVRLAKRQTIRQLYDPLGAPSQLAGWIKPNQAPVEGWSTPIRLGGKGHATYNVYNPGMVDESQFTLAHELAHNYGRRHTNTGDPSGSTSCTAKDLGTDWKRPTSRIEEPGWDFATNTVVPARRFDLMSYCPVPFKWISRFTYDRLFEANAQPRAPELSVPAPYLVVSGVVAANGLSASLDNVLTLISEATTSGSDPAGDFCLRQNESEATDYCFSISFADPDDEPLSERSFHAVLPAAQPATSIALRHNGQSLAAIAKSANSPTVGIVSPAASSSFSGTQATLTWTGSDLDPGSNLTYTVLHSANGGSTWVPILIDSTDTSFTFDANTLAGGLQGVFKVLVSDGLNTSEASVGPIVVGTARPWGDLLCDGSLSLGDAVAINRSIAGLASSPPAGCISLGALSTVYDLEGLRPWGDVRCDGVLGSDDSLAIIRAIAGLSVVPIANCPDIGVPVFATG